MTNKANEDFNEVNNDVNNDANEVNAETGNEANSKPEQETTDEANAETSDGATQAEDNETAAEELDPLTALQKAYETLEQEKAATDNQMLRLQADFDNFRKRTRAEKDEWRAMIVSGFCTDLLPVLDNFRWAVLAMEKDDSAKPHLAGVQMILKQLNDVLTAKGVEPIKTVGEDFDPKFHDAMGQVEVEDESQAGKVLEEVMAGYKIGDRVIRVARVKVGALKAAADAENQDLETDK